MIYVGVVAHHVLGEEEWGRLRKIRLTALNESPRAFLSTYAKEQAFGEQDWRAEFSRGEWNIEVRGGEAVALVGVTRERGTPPGECYLEYIWVSPGFRRRGVATDLVKNVLQRLLVLGFGTIWLWILDGNEPARCLYEKCGFSSTGTRQRPDQDSSRCEELMQLTFPGRLQ